MFRIYHIVESPLLTQLLVCFFLSWNLFSSRCRLVYKVTQFQVFLFLKLDFDVMIISKFMFRKNQLYSWWNLNVITLPGWMRMKTKKKTNAYDEDAFKGTLRLSFCSIFDLKGIFFHKHQAIFQVGRLPWQRLFVWIAEPIAAKQTIYLNRFFPYMKYGRQIVLSFQLKLSTQKNKRTKQYNPFEPPNVPILFIEQTIK